MKLGTAESGIILDVDIFNQIFKELYNKQIIPNKFSQTSPVSATVQLDSPSFQLRGGERRSSYTALHLTGTIDVSLPSGTQKDPLDAWVLLTLRLLPRTDDVPVLALQYDGLDGTPTPSYLAPYIDDFLQNRVKALTDSIQIPIFDKMVEKLEDTYYRARGAAPPGRDTWPTSTLLLEGDDQNVDAFGCFIARPGNLLNLRTASSFLPKQTGFGMVFAKRFLDFNLDTAAKAEIGTKQNDAKIVRLSMVMSDDAIMVNGQANKDVLGGLDIVKIYYSGPVKVYLKRGTYTMGADATAVVVRVDKSFLVTLLFFVNFVGSLLGFAFSEMLDLIVINKAEIEVSEAPGKVQRSLGDGLSAGLKALAEGLPSSLATSGAVVAFSPDSSVTKDGNISVLAQVFVTPVKETIANAVYGRERVRGRWRRRFLEFTLKDGRRFKASELARLMKLKVILIDGYTQVNGKYVRANPNSKRADNLLVQFGPGPRRRR